MPGWLTNGMPLDADFTGNELFPLDTELSAGSPPQSAAISLVQLAAAVAFYSNTLAVVGVNGTRWYTSVVIGSPTVINGISYLVGSTGGTDKAIVEVHNSAGVLVATSDTSGTTVGTAGTFQQIPLTAAYTAQAGTYFLTVQTNGNTAYIGTYNSPTSPLLTGNATGTFGTGASITPPTTYTAAKGPVALIY
jgi:hypothetical protein